MATVFQAEVGSVSASAGGSSGTLCAFSLASSNVGAQITLVVTVFSPITPAEFAQLKAASGSSVALTGTGDQAFFVSADSMLSFLKGNKGVGLQLQTQASGSSGAQIQRDLTTLAGNLAARL